MNRSPAHPPRLSDQPSAGDPALQRAGELLRTLRSPPVLDVAASARLDQRVAELTRATPRRIGWPVLLSAAVAAGLVAVVALPRRPTTESEFKARGPAHGLPTAPKARAADLLVYRIGPGGRSEPLGDSMRRDDELAFAYRNEGGAQRLLVFGRDEHGHFYWYHPAWTDPAQNPEAIELAREPGPHELPAAIAQPLDGRRLELCWLFTPRSLRVRQVEAALAKRELHPSCRPVRIIP